MKKQKLTLEEFKAREKIINLIRTRRQQNLYELKQMFSKVFRKIGSVCFIILRVVLIATVSACTGILSKTLIYALNKPLGMGYALFASYAEVALIGAILWSCIFDRK